MKKNETCKRGFIRTLTQNAYFIDCMAPARKPKTHLIKCSGSDRKFVNGVTGNAEHRWQGHDPTEEFSPQGINVIKIWKWLILNEIENENTLKERTKESVVRVGFFYRLCFLYQQHTSGKSLQERYAWRLPHSHKTKMTITIAYTRICTRHWLREQRFLALDVSSIVVCIDKTEVSAAIVFLSLCLCVCLIDLHKSTLYVAGLSWYTYNTNGWCTEKPAEFPPTA